jgi:hypothetical protein
MRQIPARPRWLDEQIVELAGPKLYLLWKSRVLRRHRNLIVPGFEKFSTGRIERVEWVPLEIDITVNHRPKSHFGAVHADAEIRSVIDESTSLDHRFGETLASKRLKLRNKPVLMVSYVDFFDWREILQLLLTVSFRQKMAIN